MPPPDRVTAARSEELWHWMAATPDRQTATRLDRVLRCARRARTRAVRVVVRDVSTLRRTRSAPERHVRRCGGACCPTSPRWASTCCICRRSTRSAAASARARTTRSTPGPDDPGSPWAIGSDEGGHMAIEPGLGTLDDFDRFVEAAGRHGLEIALDIAFQASPDHPYVREHPEWFRQRPDGTIKYAENPPKKYQDIYPINFESSRLAGAVAGAEARLRVLDCARRAHLPRRQSAHQAVPVLAVGARRASRASTRRPFFYPRRSPGRR